MNGKIFTIEGIDIELIENNKYNNSNKYEIVLETSYGLKVVFNKIINKIIQPNFLFGKEVKMIN